MTAKQASSVNILLIEDDQDIQCMLVMLLQRKGYQVTSFLFGQDALTYLGQAHAIPDMILLDLRLPDISGAEIFMSMQDDPRLSSIPVILMTAEPSGQHIAQQLGVSGFLAKPFAPSALLHLTEMICSPS